MRARAIREGSVGLLILVGVILFGGLVLWLRGLNIGSRNYKVTIEFETTIGMQVGTAVRYRGVPVGRILAIRPSSNRVSVLVEITDTDLRMPQQVLVEANQSGLIGETTIDITPQRSLSEAEQALNPVAPDCNSDRIICDGDTLTGEVGVSYEALLRSTEELAELFADPEIVASLKSTLQNTSAFAERATALTEELTALTQTTRQELIPLAASAQQASDSAAQAAQEIQLTVADVRDLLSANQLNITSTLENINRSSTSLVNLTSALEPVVEDDNFAGRLQTLVTNLETLSANAAAASGNFRDASADVRDITGSLNTSENRLLLQQTLESAREVFQDARKILSDVDELTGDPEVRNNLRRLIDGLSDLLSSTRYLEQQVALSSTLLPLSEATEPVTVTVPATPTEVSDNRLQPSSQPQPSPHPAAAPAPVPENPDR